MTRMNGMQLGNRGLGEELVSVIHRVRGILRSVTPILCRHSTWTTRVTRTQFEVHCPSEELIRVIRVICGFLLRAIPVSRAWER